MIGLVEQIDKLIEGEYQELKAGGNIVGKIEGLFKEIRFERPEIALYIKKKMYGYANKNGDLP